MLCPTCPLLAVQLPVGATGANPVASTNPDAGEILNAVQSTPGSHKPIDVPPKPDFTGEGNGSLHTIGIAVHAQMRGAPTGRAAFAQRSP